MPEFDYQNVEAFNTSVRLAASVGRLRIVSNLKASGEAQTKAFEQAGMAAALIAEGASRDGGAQVALYRDARGALAQCRAWLHVLAVVTNEQDAVFSAEFELADQASRQLGASLRSLERAPQGGHGGPGPGGGGSNFTPRNTPGPGPRPGGPRGNQR
jgi:hypothetical protein